MTSDNKSPESVRTPHLKAASTLILFCKGFGIGAASIVPGLSGGTIALVLGVYTQLIVIASRIDHKTITTLFRMIFQKQFRQAADYAVQTWQLTFLIPTGLGILAAIFSTASLISFTIVNYREYAFSFFFGLVLTSIYYPLKRVNKVGFRELSFFILAASLILIVQLSPLWGDLQGLSQTSLLRFFLGGAVAMATMILPGFSGSFMLVVMGVYFDIVAAVAALNLKVISIFALGCLAGLISLAKLIHYLLDNYHSITMTFLAGLMFGSLLAIWPFQKQVVIDERATITVGYQLPESLAHGWPYLICFLAGSLIVSIFIIIDRRMSGKQT